VRFEPVLKFELSFKLKFILDMYMGYMIVTVITAAIGGLIGKVLQRKIDKYLQVPMSSGRSGAEIAEEMLDHYGLYDVRIVQGQGMLTDHYNPQTKTISLSPPIYAGTSVASAAVAAHECGHAVQHAEAYAFLQMRSAVVPLVQISSKVQRFVLMGAFMGMGMASQVGGILMLACVALFSITALFSFITLPVEFDASNRALAWLDDTGAVQGEEYDGAKDALKWAAMTYVAAALSALIMVLFFLMKYMGSRR